MAFHHHIVNYARINGINSVAGAVIFAALYIPLLGWYVRQSYRHTTYVHVLLAFFCSFRVSGFIIRAILAGSNSAGENLKLLIADLVLFGVGFFGLLYSAYVLVLDRKILAGYTPPKYAIFQVMSERIIFRLALSIAVGLGIASATKNTATRNITNDDTIKNLQEASTIIFLILTVLQAIQTLVLARMVFSGARQPHDSKAPEPSIFGSKHAIYILLLISFLLLLRQSFAMATVSNFTKRNDETLWYPLIAVPEILAVFLYSTPGLVPLRPKPTTTYTSA